MAIGGRAIGQGMRWIVLVLLLLLGAQTTHAALSDSDGDGLDDAWENGAGKVLGAKIGRKDIFFQIDWQYCVAFADNNKPADVFSHPFDPGNQPRLGKDSILYFIRYFWKSFDPANPWCAHIDNGQTIWDCDDLNADATDITMNPARVPLAKARMVGPLQSAAADSQSDSFRYNFFFPPERAQKFHYGVTGCTGGGTTSVDDILAEFGPSGMAMLHELGHKWHRNHGGEDDHNYKYNYPSIMNYSLNYSAKIDGFSMSKFPTLNEWAVCEKNGLGIPLSGQLTTVTDSDSQLAYTIPKELAYLLDMGVAPRFIYADGGIDWNKDGIVSPCATSADQLQEINLEANFGDFPIARDSAFVGNTDFAPALISRGTQLFMVYVDHELNVRVQQGPTAEQVTALRKNLANKNDVTLLLFPVGQSEIVYAKNQSLAGAIASSPVAIVPSDKQQGDLVMTFTTTSHALIILPIFLQPDSGTKGWKVIPPKPTIIGPAPIATAMGGHYLCDAMVADSPTTKSIYVVARDCDTGQLYQVQPAKVSGAAPKLIDLQERSLVAPALVSGANGKFYLAIARPPNASDTECSPNESQLRVVTYQEKQSILQWQGATRVGQNESACLRVTRPLSALFDPSPKRSLGGRIAIYYQGAKPDHAYNLYYAYHDLAAQTHPNGGTFYGMMKSTLLAWEPAKEKFGVGAAPRGTMFAGHPVFAYFMNSKDAPQPTDLAPQGRLEFSPAADGINRDVLESSNDRDVVAKQLPLSIASMPLVDLSVRKGFEKDQDGDGTPDAQDNCPHDYNRPTAKGASGIPLGDVAGAACGPCTKVIVGDQNACTVDFCNATSGLVSHMPVSVDDGQICTNDVCDPKTGNITHSPTSDDQNACTVDSCSPTTGMVSHVSKCPGQQCEKKTGQCGPAPANGGALASLGVPTGSKPAGGVSASTTGGGGGAGVDVPCADIDDQNACTLDQCAATSGQVTHTKFLQCLAGESCNATLKLCEPAAAPSPAVVPAPVTPLRHRLASIAGTRCYLRDDGRVVCWGANDKGQLGRGVVSMSQDKISPGVVPGLKHVVSIGGWNDVVCAVTDEGAVYCWGGEAAAATSSSTPKKISVPAAADLHFFEDTVRLLLKDGSELLYTLKTGIAANLFSGKVLGVNTSSYDANYVVSCVSLQDQTVKCRTPVTAVTNLTVPVVSLTMGEESLCVMDAVGSVMCACATSESLLPYCNNNGDLGDGTTMAHTDFVKVDLPSAAKSFASGSAHSCAVLFDGTVSCWGFNGGGQVTGAQTTDNKAIPLPLVVPDLTDVVTVAADDCVSCAQRSDGSVWCWGMDPLFVPPQLITLKPHLVFGPAPK